MKIKLILLSILILAALIRIIGLESFPVGLSGDEAGQGYSAYSIAKTGKDEWGVFLPLTPRGFGDYKAPLLTYLMIPSVSLFGLNIVSVRLPSAVLGVLTVLAVYFLALEMFKVRQVALWSAFILTINPWHIQLSRTASEGITGVLFFALALLFLLKSNTKKRAIIFSAICFGLLFYSYHSFRVFEVLFLWAVIIFLRGKVFIKNKLIFFAVLLIFLLPLILNYKTTLARASDVGIFSQKNIEGFYAGKGVSPIPYSLDRLFDNKIWFVTSYIANNYLAYLSSTFLFTGWRSNENYLNFADFGLLYPIEFVFWVVAFYSLIKRKDASLRLILLWLVLAPIPGAITTGGPQANRAVTLLPLTALLSGLGIKETLEWLGGRFKILPLKLMVVACVVLAVHLFGFLYFYTIRVPKNPAPSIRGGYPEVFKKALAVQGSYDQIIVSKNFTVPQVFVAFFGKVDPIEYQKASQIWLGYEKAGYTYMDQQPTWSLRKFTFRSLEWKNVDSKEKNSLAVGRKDEFPEKISSIFDYRDSRGNVLYRLIPTNQEVSK